MVALPAYAQLNIEEDCVFSATTKEDYYTATDGSCLFIANVYILRLNKDSTFKLKIVHVYEDCPTKFNMCDSTWGTYRMEDGYIILKSAKEEDYKIFYASTSCLWFRYESKKFFIINEDELLYTVPYRIKDTRQILFRRKKEDSYKNKKRKLWHSYMDKDI